MNRYVLIESRDPYTAADVLKDYALARELAAKGEEVTFFLVQNGVLPARREASAPELHALARAGVSVVADEFSLRERAISAGDLAPGIAPAPLDVVLDGLADGRRTLFL